MSDTREFFALLGQHADASVVDALERAVGNTSDLHRITLLRLRLNSGTES